MNDGREEGTEEEVIGKRGREGRLGKERRKGKRRMRMGREEGDGEEGKKGRGDISEGEESIIYNNRVYNV